MSLSILKNIRGILLYNSWANEQVLKNISEVKRDDYFKEFPIPFKNLHGLLNHLYYYDAKYYHQIMGELDFIKKDDKQSSELLFENILQYSQKWIEWVDLLISTSNMEKLENNFASVFDLQIHNNYHRGQLNILMMILGYRPQSLDVFFYKHSFVSITGEIS